MSGEQIAGPAALCISAVLPAWNEAANLARTAAEVAEALEESARRFELIVVDDGSDDGTGEIADRLAGEDPRVRAVHHHENRGYGAAIRSGIEAARYEWIFFTDADGQFDPSEIKKLVGHAGQSPFVAGYRSPRMDPLARRLYGRVFTGIVRALFRVKSRDVNCAFKLFKKELLEGARLESEGALINAEILVAAARRGVEPVEVPVRHRPRRAGEASGGSLRVVLRAGKEILALWLGLRAKP